MEGFIEGLLDDIASIGPEWLLVGAFFLAFFETVMGTDVLIPGELALILVGAATERVDGAPLPAVIAVAALGATLGDSVGWTLGRFVGTRVVQRWKWTRVHVAPKLERARAYFGERGGAAVFFGRFVGPLRAVVSVVAGMSGMPYRRFIVWNVLASIAWTSLVISAGYFFGRHVKSVVSDVGIAIAATAVVGSLTFFLVRRHRRRRARQEAWRPPSSMASGSSSSQSSASSSSESRQLG